MSHFSTIKTKLKDKKVLVKALNTLSYKARENVLLDNPVDHDHKQWNVDVALSNDIGFRLNKNTGTYELVAELDTWNLDVPVSRFIDKVSQQYARHLVVDQAVSKGFRLAEEKMKDGTIELVMKRWV